MPICVLLYGLCLVLAPAAVSETLYVEVENIEVADGWIWIGVYDSPQAFLNKEKAVVVKGYEVSKTGRMRLQVPDLPFGKYALALFHDVNGNGLMDQNFLGIPTEPYAFSRKPRSRWRVPRFDEVQFSFWQKQQALGLRLERW